MVFTDAEGKVAGRFSGELAEVQLQELLTALGEGQPLSSVSGGASSA